jgi:16S rRNA (guanine527-N7)-methyltransferase
VKRPRREAPDATPDAIASEVAGLLKAAPELQSLALPQAFFSRMERFAATLAIWGARSNLTASPQSAKEISFHIVDSLAPLWAERDGLRGAGDGFEKFSPGQATRIIDLGSGAGFPGLVLAAATEAQFTLVESRRKRASFLSVAAAEMQLGNVSVRWARAESSTADDRFDIATARAVAELGETLNLAARMLRAGGLAIFYASAGQALDIARAERVGLSPAGEVRYEVSRGGERVAHALILMRLRD